MTGMEYVAVCLGSGLVFTLALLIVALGCIDDLQDELKRARRLALLFMDMEEEK